MIHSYFGLNQEHKNGKKIKKNMYYYVLITTNYYNKSYELNTKIIYTKMTNNDDIKQF